VEALPADRSLDPDAFRNAVMTELVQRDIAEVVIEFDGCGDEGQIDSMHCTKVDGTEGSLEFPSNIPGTRVSAGSMIWNHRASKYVNEPVDRPAMMADILDEWAYELLQQTGVDWINNEGGYGQILIVPSADLIECTMHARFIDSITSHHEL
jgi:hypothetical protein